MPNNSRVKIFYIIFLSILCLLSFRSFSEASCGGTNCSLVTGTQNGVTSKDRFVMDLSYRYVLSENPHRGSDSTNQALTPKINFETRSIQLDQHKEIRTVNKLAQFDVSYGVTEKFTLSLNIPFFNDRLHEHEEAGVFKNTDGTSGFGDITLMAKYVLWQTTKQMVIGGVGMKFATGEYKLKDGEGGINEPTLMPGTGSYDAIVSGMYTYSIIPRRLNFFTSATHRFTTENDLDYLAGNTTLVNFGMGKVPLSVEIEQCLTPL